MNLSHFLQIEQSPLTTDTSLTDLPAYSYQVDKGTIVDEIDKRLRAESILPGVIITSNEQAAGIISRRKFFEQLGQLYGVSVYLKRPISLVLEAIGAEPLLMPATASVAEAITRALNRPRNFVYEPIIVEYGERVYRMIDVYTLLIAQSQLLTHLQVELQYANEKLEARIERRTAELVEANANLTKEISRRQKIEEELIQARDQALTASRLKSELMAKVSHELRTPLGGILGYAEMLQLGIYGELSEQQVQATGQIIKSTNYLAELVNQLLDQAKFDAGRQTLHIGRFSPVEMTNETVSKLMVLAQAKGLALTTEIASDMPASLSGDAVRVKQILVNLVSNAVKFTEQGSVQIRLFRPDDLHWAMEVSDTGPGIPAKAQSYIFEPFGQVDGSITRQHTGTGLGLSIVRQLVELMNGQIKLESKVGQGSRFTIILPLQLSKEKTV